MTDDFDEEVPTMVGEWLGTTGTEAALVVVSAVAILAWVIVVVRVVGLRSFSKMSGFDFAVTLAVGSIVASVAATSTSLAHGAIAVVVLLTAQAVVARLRVAGDAETVVDNSPVMLMDGSTFCEDAMARTRVTRADVMAKLRQAGVWDLDQVLAVVLETTGDISVIAGDGPLDEQLLEGVGSGGRRLRGSSR